MVKKRKVFSTHSSTQSIWFFLLLLILLLLPFTVSDCSRFARFQRSERGAYQRHSEAHLSLHAPIPLSSDFSLFISNIVPSFLSNRSRCSSLLSSRSWISKMHSSRRFSRAPKPIENSRAIWWNQRTFCFSARFIIELMARCTSCALSRFHCKLRFVVVVFLVKLC